MFENLEIKGLTKGEKFILILGYTALVFGVGFIIGFLI